MSALEWAKIAWDDVVAAHEYAADCRAEDNSNGKHKVRQTTQNGETQVLTKDSITHTKRGQLDGHEVIAHLQKLVNGPSLAPRHTRASKWLTGQGQPTMKHMINHQYIEVTDTEGPDSGPHLHPRHAGRERTPYALPLLRCLTNGEYIKNRKRALAMATRLGKQLGMEVHAP